MSKLIDLDELNIFLGEIRDEIPVKLSDLKGEKRNTATSGTVTLNPNEFTSITPSANVTIALGAFSDSANYICGYHCVVNNSGNKTVTLPSGVTWMNGTPTIESGTVIEMHFLRDNSTVYGAWADPSKVGGGGDTNVIETVKVNGTALTPDNNKAVNVIVPAAGDTNVIETVKVNGTALTPDANKAVDIKGIITRTDVTGTSVTQSLTPNVFYSFGTMTSLTVTLGSTVSGANNLYSFEFSSGTVATTLTLPNTIIWQEDTVTIEPCTHYEISVKYSPKDEMYYGMISSWYTGLPGNSLQLDNINYNNGMPYAGQSGKVLAVGNDYDYSDLSDFKLYDQDGLEVQYISINSADSSSLDLQINFSQKVLIDTSTLNYSTEAGGGSNN